MRSDEYAAMDGLAIAAAVRSGQVSALEVTDAAIAAIEALNPVLNALVLKDFDRARDPDAASRDAALALGQDQDGKSS